MKKKLISAVAIVCLSVSVFSQGISDVAYKYLLEYSDTAMLYRDVVISNVDDGSWPAVGIMREEVSFYYSYSHLTGEILSMVSKYSRLSQVGYTQYYIYDGYQNLKYFIYESEETSLVLYIADDYVEKVYESGMDKFSDNYFVEFDYMFDPEVIREKSDFMISYLSILWGTPNLNHTKDYIVKVFKEINAMKNLVERKSESVTAYYNEGKLVKIIDKEYGVKEYYIENDRLLFAYYTAIGDEPEYRAYFYNKIAFKFIYGKDDLSRHDYEFYDYSQTVIDEYEIVLELFEQK